VRGRVGAASGCSAARGRGEGRKEREREGGKRKGKRKKGNGKRKRERKGEREKERGRDGGDFGDDCGGVGHACCDVQSDDSRGARRKREMGQQSDSGVGSGNGFGEIRLGQEELSSTTKRILKIIF
jgi:hypothetical protein